MEKLGGIARPTNSEVLGASHCPETNEQVNALKRCVKSIPDPKESPVCVEQDTANNLSNNRHLLKLNLNLANCHGFVGSSASTIARITLDPADRFSYLVHHCANDAVQTSRRCGVLKPEEGRAEALRTLLLSFSDPHIIATTSMEEASEAHEAADAFP
ncbi:hypothetical protein X801_01261, partial [Opisthorchis viverrini]